METQLRTAMKMNEIKARAGVITALQNGAFLTLFRQYLSNANNYFLFSKFIQLLYHTLI